MTHEGLEVTRKHKIKCIQYQKIRPKKNIKRINVNVSLHLNPNKIMSDLSIGKAIQD